MPIANSDNVPDPFPGIALPSGTGAPGTDGPGPRDTDAVQTTITDPPGDPWSRVSTSTHGTTQPGQTNDGWTGIPSGDLTDTGAGSGHTDAWARHSWQEAAS